MLNDNDLCISTVDSG